jgi:RNA recognition motif-containing protein
MATQDRALGIYIKGINEDTSELDCKTAFSIYGDIIDVYLNSARGYALVHFSTATAASAAAESGVSILGGVPVEVAARTPRKARTVEDSENLYLHGIDANTSRNEASEALAAFGTVIYVKLYGTRGFAFAAMESVEAAKAAVAASPLTFGDLDSVVCEPRRSTPRNRLNKSRSEKAPRDLSADIYIKGLTPENVEHSNKDALQEAFNVYGAIDRVMLRRDRDFAFITFAEPSAVAKAVAASGAITINGMTVVVEARKPRERREA